MVDLRGATMNPQLSGTMGQTVDNVDRSADCHLPALPKFSVDFRGDSLDGVNSWSMVLTTQRHRGDRNPRSSPGARAEEPNRGECRAVWGGCPARSVLGAFSPRRSPRPTISALVAATLRPDPTVVDRVNHHLTRTSFFDRARYVVCQAKQTGRAADELQTSGGGADQRLLDADIEVDTDYFNGGIRRTSQRLAEIEYRVSSPSDEVTVFVGGDASLRDIVIADGSLDDRDPDQMARLLVTTIRHAEQVAGAAMESVGAVDLEPR